MNRGGEPVFVGLERGDARLHIRFPSPQGQGEIIIDRKRAFMINSHIFIVWVIAFSLLMVALAIGFLNQQVRSILRLSEAARAFGRGRDLPEQYQDLMKRAWGPVRVCIAAEIAHGNEVLGPLYTALGTRIHREGRTDFPRIISESLAEAGLPADLALAADSSEFDPQLRASHTRGITLVGSDVGTPVLAVPGPKGEPVAFFGPVITPMPLGEDAATLWDGALMVASIPGFYELKRTRDAEPSFD
jgi:hypothetical protein